nr:DUF4124 domain-containing protein [Massilia sp. Dwa41.01b]
MKNFMTVLVLCAFGSGAAAQTVYKCTSDGKVSYGERPCAAGTTAVVPSPTPGDPAAAAARLARQKAVLEEVDKQEQVRLVRLEKEMRERLKMQRADAAAQEVRTPAPEAALGPRRPGPDGRPGRPGPQPESTAAGRSTGGGMSGLNPLSRWLLLGEWRAHPVRALLAVVAIAVGVAMGFAIHLINAAAFNEFSSAIKSLSGQADVQVHGREALFDETVYPRLARYEGVAIASPVLELQAAVPKARGALRLVGIDALRAPPTLRRTCWAYRATGAPAICWTTAASSCRRPPRPGSAPAPGRAGAACRHRDFALRVAGPVQRARPGQRFGVMDIGASNGASASWASSRAWTSNYDRA